MKKLILSTAFLSLATFAFAQNTPKMQKKDAAAMEQKRAEHLNKMQAELNLTPAQMMKIKAMHEQKMAIRKEMAPQRIAERKAKMEQRRARQQQHQAEMQQILSPEQYQKWMSKKGDGRMMKGKHMNRPSQKKIIKA